MCSIKTMFRHNICDRTKRENEHGGMCALSKVENKSIFNAWRRIKKDENSKETSAACSVKWVSEHNNDENSVFQFYVGFFITMMMKWRHKHFIYETRTMHCMPTVWCGRSTHILKRSKCQRNQMSCAEKDRERQFIKKKTTTRRTVKPKHCRHWPKCMGKTALHYRGFWAMNSRGLFSFHFINCRNGMSHMKSKIGQ